MCIKRVGEKEKKWYGDHPLFALITQRYHCTIIFLKKKQTNGRFKYKYVHSAYVYINNIQISRAYLIDQIMIFFIYSDHQKEFSFFF